MKAVPSGPGPWTKICTSCGTKGSGFCYYPHVAVCTNCGSNKHLVFEPVDRTPTPLVDTGSTPAPQINRRQTF